MKNPNQELINRAFDKYNVRSYADLGKQTGISHATIRRIFENNEWRCLLLKIESLVNVGMCYQIGSVSNRQNAYSVFL
jgi:hypothetical protein